jgi:hypothetical protein
MEAREEAFRLVSKGGHTHDEAILEKANEKQVEAARLAKEVGGGEGDKE